jgi:hypothetical protein
MSHLLPGANGNLEVSVDGISWTPSPHHLHTYESWVVPWEEIDSIETVGAVGRPIAHNLRLDTAGGVVDLWISQLDVDPLLDAARVYLHPDA